MLNEYMHNIEPGSEDCMSDGKLRLVVVGSL